MDFDETAERAKLSEIGLTDDMIEMIVAKKRELYNSRRPVMTIEELPKQIAIVPVLEIDDIPASENNEPEYFPQEVLEPVENIQPQIELRKKRPSAFSRMK